MMHDVTRIWRTAPLPDSSNEAAAEIRRCGSWTSCTAWSWRGLLLLNDQMSPDGAFKLAIIRLTGPERRTSIEEQRKIERCAAGDAEIWSRGTVLLDRTDGHRCEHCA